MTPMRDHLKRVHWSVWPIAGAILLIVIWDLVWPFAD